MPDLITDLNPNPDEASRRAIVAWMNYLGIFTKIRRMCEIVSAGVEASRDSVYRQGYRAPELMQSIDLTVPNLESFNAETRHRIAREYVGSFEQTIQGTVDSASIVFAHSVLDDAATECFRIISVADPGTWEERFANKKHTLIDVRRKGADQIYLECVNDFLNNVGRSTSLQDRIQIIHAKCPPSGRFTVLHEPFAFDWERIAPIETLRQSIVHGLQMAIRVQETQNYIEYTERAALYLLTLVIRAYRLRLDPNDYFVSLRG